ncbi:MAG: LuxR C-terminal-related transcriptional regulator, partial [Mycobacteriales bacterium]
MLGSAPSPDLLVIACDPAAPGAAQVFLAEREELTDGERLFVGDGQVVRVPRDAPVAVRPVLRDAQIPRQPTCSDGERALLAAVSAVRRAAPAPVPTEQPTVLEERLRAALLRGDAAASAALAPAMRHERGLPAVHELLRAVLAEVGLSWEQGRTTVLAEHQATAAAFAVVHSLRAGAARRRVSTGTVVLACAPGDRHDLGLLALSDLLEDAGHATLLAGDLPLGELLDVVARPDTRALVVSAHNRVSADGASQLVEAVRRRAPQLALALGGPGFRDTPALRRCRPDLLGSDVTALLALLDRTGEPVLTAREGQVLAAVADGLTNAEIGRLLGIAPATVKSHLDNVLVKTGTEHRAAAVARALRAGWIR